MPIFALLGLILSIIKIGMDVAAYLKAHPETTTEMKTVLERAHFTLSQVHADLSAYDATKDYQGP